MTAAVTVSIFRNGRREGAGPAAEKDEAMGQFGKLTRVEDLPPEPELIAMIHAAMALIDAGVKTHRTPRMPRAEVAMPDTSSLISPIRPMIRCSACPVALTRSTPAST